jgi:RNA polymerase sigma factor (sigma-70 family)
MMKHTDPEEHLRDLAAPAARSVARQFDGYVDTNDLIQEIHVYILTHPKLAEELLEAYVEGREQTRWTARRIMARMRRYAERFARKEKAEKLGYKTGDEFFYDQAMIAELMPAAINFETTAELIVEHVDDGQPKRPSAPSEGGNLIAMIVDIRRIYDKLSTEDQQMLEQYYTQEMTFEQLAQAWNISKSTAERRVKELLRFINRQLGGPTPWS